MGKDESALEECQRQFDPYHFIVLPAVYNLSGSEDRDFDAVIGEVVGDSDPVPPLRQIEEDLAVLLGEGTPESQNPILISWLLRVKEIIIPL